MPSLEVGSRRIKYVVVRGASRRYTYFRFRPDMTLEVVRPRESNFNAETAIKSKLGWILREYERIANTKRILSPDYVMVNGKHLKLVFVESSDEALLPNEVSGEVVVRTSDRNRIKELVRRWFLKETSAYVVRKVRELSPLLGVKPNRVDVREISKWGYCTRGGRLSFSWQLIALPERLGEYIVLHELTHLVEFNHSSAFRRRLASICPDFRLRERELGRILPYDHMTVM